MIDSQNHKITKSQSWIENHMITWSHENMMIWRKKEWRITWSHDLKEVRIHWKTFLCTWLWIKLESWSWNHSSPTGTREKSLAAFGTREPQPTTSSKLFWMFWNVRKLLIFSSWKTQMIFWKNHRWKKQNILLLQVILVK